MTGGGWEIQNEIVKENLGCTALEKFQLISNLKKISPVHENTKLNNTTYRKNMELM